MSQRACLETLGLRYYHFNAPLAGDINYKDVAVALGNECRFGGFVKRFYSVAEHALLVRHLVPDELKFAALHHDSHEAYLRDIPSPVKAELATAGTRYKELCALADSAIGEAFGIKPALFDDPIVKQADRLACRIEAAVLKDSRGEGPHWQSYWDEWEIGTPPEPPWRLGMNPPQAQTVFLGVHLAEALR